ncbi:acyl-CoA N-acyltransferase [Lipomyces oligophaga]|uniref:acyl-CoA N-acyltransferase n=1 Tax=Lipomyces oligophaga TaxID=45792 RepID=UPI0034CEE01B
MTAFILPTGASCTVTSAATELTWILGNTESYVVKHNEQQLVKFQRKSNSIDLEKDDVPEIPISYKLWIALYILFEKFPTTDLFVGELRFAISFGDRRILSPFLAEEGDEHRLCIHASRHIFFQYNLPPAIGLSYLQTWRLQTTSASAIPTDYTTDLNSTGIAVQHPVRPIKPPPGTFLYGRYIPKLKQHLTFRVLNSQTDLEVFKTWMRLDRVNRFWNMANADHAGYLKKQRADKHTIPIIGSFDGQDFLYSELYYVAEDHLAPYTSGLAGEFDMGFHLLVGNESLRGPHRVHQWLPSIVHLLFLEDTRVNAIFLEPRSDNEKLISYLLQLGFTKHFEFQFPHKKAALMRIERHIFFASLIF